MEVVHLVRHALHTLAFSPTPAFHQQRGKHTGNSQALWYKGVPTWCAPTCLLWIQCLCCVCVELRPPTLPFATGQSAAARLMHQLVAGNRAAPPVRHPPRQVAVRGWALWQLCQSVAAASALARLVLPWPSKPGQALSDAPNVAISVAECPPIYSGFLQGRRGWGGGGGGGVSAASS